MLASGARTCRLALTPMSGGLHLYCGDVRSCTRAGVGWEARADVLGGEGGAGGGAAAAQAAGADGTQGAVDGTGTLTVVKPGQAVLSPLQLCYTSTYVRARWQLLRARKLLKLQGKLG